MTLYLIFRINYNLGHSDFLKANGALRGLTESLNKAWIIHCISCLELC